MAHKRQIRPCSALTAAAGSPPKKASSLLENWARKTNERGQACTARCGAHLLERRVSLFMSFAAAAATSLSIAATCARSIHAGKHMQIRSEQFNSTAACYSRAMLLLGLSAGFQILLWNLRSSRRIQRLQLWRHHWQQRRGAGGRQGDGWARMVHQAATRRANPGFWPRWPQWF